MGGDAPEWHFAKFTGGEIQPVPEITKAVNRILIDKADNKWLATRQGLIKYDGTTFVTWNTGNSDLPDNDIRDIKQDASGNLWLACGRYLVRFDGRNEFAVYQIPPPAQENKERDPVSSKPLPENNEISTILCLEFDDRGNIWFGTESSGLFKFTQVQESFRQVLNSPTSIQAVSGKKANSDLFVCGAGSELSVDFLLNDAAKISLSVFDMQGREVVSFVKQSQLSAGQYSYSIKQAKGIYLVEYIADGNASVKKVVVQ